MVEKEGVTRHTVLPVHEYTCTYQNYTNASIQTMVMKSYVHITYTNNNSIFSQLLCSLNRKKLHDITLITKNDV